MHGAHLQVVQLILATQLIHVADDRLLVGADSIPRRSGYQHKQSLSRYCLGLDHSEAQDPEQGYQSRFSHGGRIRDGGVLGLVLCQASDLGTSSATTGSGESGIQEFLDALVPFPNEAPAWPRWPSKRSNFRFEGRADSSVPAWAFDGPN